MILMSITIIMKMIQMIDLTAIIIITKMTITKMLITAKTITITNQNNNMK